MTSSFGGYLRDIMRDETGVPMDEDTRNCVKISIGSDTFEARGNFEPKDLEPLFNRWSGIVAPNGKTTQQQIDEQADALDASTRDLAAAVDESTVPPTP